MTNKVTINDVARLAGVSKVTVSYILNNRQTAVKISDDTRSRIWAAVKELNYHPNGLARALARKQSDALAIVLQFPSVFSGWSGFINEMMHGATDKSVELGFDLMIHTKFQPTVEGEVNTLSDGRVDGALLLRDWDDPLAEMLTEKGFPCVLTFARSAAPNVAFVDCDNEAGGRLATEHLIRLGHTNIIHLSGSKHVSAAIDRLNGYKSSLKSHDITVNEQNIIEITNAEEDFSVLIDRLKSKDKPTAIFAWSDEVAIQAIKTAQSIGLKVPNDVAVIGYDSTIVCDLPRPRLTSIRQPIYDMAASAVELLSQMIKGITQEETSKLFSPTLDIRESCGGEQLKFAAIRTT